SAVKFSSTASSIAFSRNAAPQNLRPSEPDCGRRLCHARSRNYSRHSGTSFPPMRPLKPPTWPPKLPMRAPPKPPMRPPPKPPKWPPANPPVGPPPAEAADVAAAAKAAMPTAETATTGVRCEGHERNCEQQHRGSGDAGLQHRPHVSEFSQFRFSDRRYRCELLRVAKICRR